MFTISPVSHAVVNLFCELTLKAVQINSPPPPQRWIPGGVGLSPCQAELTWVSLSLSLSHIPNDGILGGHVAMPAAE